MSHALGAVRFDTDGLVLWYDYDGTADIAITALVDTHEAVKFRQMPRCTCTCGKDEPVEIASDYGNGSFWTGRACRHCRAITTGRIRDNVDEVTRGHPAWWPL